MQIFKAFLDMLVRDFFSPPVKPLKPQIFFGKTGKKMIGFFLTDNEYIGVV